MIFFLVAFIRICAFLLFCAVREWRIGSVQYLFKYINKNLHHYSFSTYRFCTISFFFMGRYLFCLLCRVCWWIEEFLLLLFLFLLFDVVYLFIYLFHYLYFCTWYMFVHWNSLIILHFKCMELFCNFFIIYFFVPSRLDLNKIRILY